MERIKTTNIEIMESHNCIQYCGGDKNKCVYTSPCQIFENCYEKENERLTCAEINNVINIVSRYNNKAVGEFDYTLQEGYPEGYVACIYNKWEEK